MPKTKKLLIIFFALGVIYRLAIAYLFPQPVVFDAQQYVDFAFKILREGLGTVSASRTYGYPLFLAVIYQVFWQQHELAVRLIQSLLDCTNALIIYYLTGRLGFKKTARWLGFLLYIFNPFTAYFAGVFTSETLATFITSLIFLLLILFILKRKSVFLYVLGFCLGFLPQVRPIFVYSGILGVIIIWFLTIKKHLVTKLIPGLSIFSLLFLLPFIYSFYGNYISFRSISPLTISNIGVREFYISLYVDKITEPPINNFVYPAPVQQIYAEYETAFSSETGREQLTDKYLKQSLEKVGQNPVAFIFSRIWKMWYVWEKYFIFYYREQPGILEKAISYWSNLGLLFLAVVGYYLFSKEGRTHTKIAKFFGRMSLLFCLYISVAYVFSTSEGRYSLPAYPFICLFAGEGISKIIDKAQMKLRKIAVV